MTVIDHGPRRRAMARRRRPHGDRPSRRRRWGNPEPDYLQEAVEENWPHILMAYRQFEDKKPVVLYDIQEKRIYVYPYADFLSDLSEKSRLTLKDQYERAIQGNKIVVFVRDNEQRRLVSFSMNNE
jgi:hypothetical protein